MSEAGDRVAVRAVWKKSLNKKLEGGKMGLAQPVVIKPEGKRLSMIW